MCVAIQHCAVAVRLGWPRLHLSPLTGDERVYYGAVGETAIVGVVWVAEAEPRPLIGHDTKFERSE